jgi:hypothetical protein
MKHSIDHNQLRLSSFRERVLQIDDSQLHFENIYLGLNHLEFQSSESTKLDNQYVLIINKKCNIERLGKSLNILIIFYFLTRSSRGK